MKLDPSGDIPDKRAAHAAVAINQQSLAVYGGAADKGELASDDLFILEVPYEENSARWIKCFTTSNTPGKRYGHTLAFFDSYIIVIGGNLGNKVTNDTWICKVDKIPEITWTCLNIPGQKPSPRMYHATALCKYGGASNMLITFGGRGEKNEYLNDCWGLRKHRNGTWDWQLAPYSKNYMPRNRFQHTANFYYNFLIIVGGRSDIEPKTVPIEIYDTDTSEWESVAMFNKFRHTAWLVGNFIYTHGGYEIQNTTIAKSDMITIDLKKLFGTNETLQRKLSKIQADEERKKKQLIENANKRKELTPSMSPVNGHSSNNNNNNAQRSNNRFGPSYVHSNMPMESIVRPQIQKQGEIAMMKNRKEDKVKIQKIQFDEQWKWSIPQELKNKPLCDRVIDILLRPSHWINGDGEDLQSFPFDINEIGDLTKQCIDIVKNQPIVLKISTPVKVFGDIHGQYIDLMNFFDKWGCPSESINGDLMINDYLFLGDYVDRGNMSLETICLLMALKIKYPDQIHLLRGNHEDILINSTFGFGTECDERLGDDYESDDSLFKLINDFFEYLPLAAVIEDQILCLHGGIGANVKKISDIENIERPCEVIHEANTLSEKIVMDILWSDPTDTDDDKGIMPNTQRDTSGMGNIVKYGPDVVKEFLKVNKLSHIIRAHECVLDGFERFAGGSLITVFSATDYCGRHGNAGAMVVINQQRAMIPHLIYPPSGGNTNWINNAEYYKKRPPTPPRVRYYPQSY